MTTTMTQQPFTRRPLAAALGMAMASLMFLPTAWAQSAPAPAASEAVSDRVKKDAAGPLYWIRLNAQKADAATKPAPRITEVRAERPAPRPAAAPAAVASTQAPSNGGGTSVASSGPAPASGGNVASGSTPDGGQGRELATLLPNASAAPAGAGAGGTAAGAAGAGLVAPSGPSATETARAADEPDDEPLALLKGEEPAFPANAVRKLRKGTVQVRFEVQADGTVANTSIVQTSHRSLNEAAIEAVNGWRFQPVRSPRSAVVDLGFDLDG